MTGAGGMTGGGMPGGRMTGSGNFVAPILAHCAARPDHTAIVLPDPDGGAATRISYAELARDIAAWQTGLERAGFQAGDRVVLLFRPDRRLYALLLALFAAGMVPVFIDAGMGARKILWAIEDAAPRAVITIGRLLRLRPLFAALRRRPCYNADDTGPGMPLSSLHADQARAPVVVPRGPDDHALITFTSGSTGRPKGADRTHGLLLAQHAALDAAWPLGPGDRPVTALPIFLLHGLACGVTTILADCDLARPGAVDPARMLRQLADERATMLVSAPAFALRVADHLAATGTSLPDLHTVFIGGAPSSPAMVARYQAGFGEGRVAIVYGSTEAEPIAMVRAEEILADPRPAVLVGRPAPHTRIMVVALAGGPPWTEATVAAAELPDGTVGEILVKGPHVLKRYVDNPAATADSKVPCADGEVWHRTGDRGYRDAQGRLWLTGRDRDVVNHPSGALEPFPIEITAEAIPGVRRAALVGLPTLPRPDLLVELEPTADRAATLAALRAALPSDPWPSGSIRAVDAIPVDGRHNSKVDRPALRAAMARVAVGPVEGARWIVRLNIVDVLSLVGAATALLGVWLALQGRFGLALAALSAAMLADALDGHFARRLNTLRPFGRYLDGFVDTLDYLVAPALFLLLWGFDGPLDMIALLAMVWAGMIRLAVFNEIGNLPRPQAPSPQGKPGQGQQVQAAPRPGYLGMPVFWTVFILWGAYLLAQVLERWIVFWLLDIALIAAAVAMLRNALFFKFTRFWHLLAIPGAGIVVFGLLGLHEMGPGMIGAVLLPVAAALVMVLPCVIGMSLHMFVVARDRLPALKIPIHTGLFGANKTWRGFIVGPPLCILGAIPAVWLAKPLPMLSGVTQDLAGIVFLGLAMGTAYMLFELPNSFIKRRIGIPPGGQSGRHAWVFIAADQIDSGIGMGLCATLVFGAPWSVAILIIVLFPFVALAVKRLLFAMRWKKTAV